MAKDEKIGCGCSGGDGDDNSCCSESTDKIELTAIKPANTGCCGDHSVVAPPSDISSCCPPPVEEYAGERPGIRVWPFVEKWLETEVGPVPVVSSELTRGDKLGRWAMRWGIGRDKFRVAPGIYAIGNPGPNSYVMVTCNYKMTFDEVRSAWKGLDLWVLVLETYGVNVWCAAGKGTFGTAELIERVKATGLEKLVNHKKLILPQLGAPGVSAHEVKKESGFKVNYGPIRATDVLAYLKNDMQTTKAMRKVTFTTMERLALAPVELMMLKGYVHWALLAALVVSGVGPYFWSPAAALYRGFGLFGIILVGGLAGAVVTPLLLDKLYGQFFAVKGAICGAALSLLALLVMGGPLNWLESLAMIGAGAAVSSFAAMNFTGATTFTSPSGVEKEMRKVIPYQAGGAALSLVGWVVGAFI